MPEKPKLVEKNKRHFNAYMKYSGLGIQMGLIITVFAYGGLCLDNWLAAKPVFVVILSLSGVGLSFYVFIKQLTTSASEDKSKKTDH